MSCTPRPTATAATKGMPTRTVHTDSGFSADLCTSFVEFETAADLRTAVEKLDGREFKNVRVTCVANVRYRPPWFRLSTWLTVMSRLSLIFPGVTVPVRGPRAARILLRWMTMTAAALRVDIAPAGTATGMATVSAPRPLVGSIMMTEGEATVRRPRAAVRRWTTIRPLVAATRTLTGPHGTTRRPTRT